MKEDCWDKIVLKSIVINDKRTLYKVVDKVFAKVSHLIYRYMLNQMALFLMETEQYDVDWRASYAIIVLLIQILGRWQDLCQWIENRLKVTNRVIFPQKIENVLEASYSPLFYGNQLLAKSMEAFRMIDTATLEIRWAIIYKKQNNFSMSNYNVSSRT